MGIIEGNELHGDHTETADVVVIGSGIGGATAAMVLAEAGKRVIVLEQGGYYTGLVDPIDPSRPGRGTLDQREDDMFARIDGERGLATSTDGRVPLSFGRCVGGASVHYWADSYRAPADRLAQWEREHGLEGFGSDDLAPYFARYEADLGVHPAPDEYFNGCNRVFRRGVEALGWQGDRVPQARRGCVKSGYCMQGCAYNAKQSMLVTYLPRAIRAGAMVFADCRVEAIALAGGRACVARAAVLNRDTGEPTGRVLHVKAGAVVLAAGGYGSAALWVRSGLPNTAGMVGRNLTCNPCAMAFGYFAEDIVMWRNIPAAFGCLHWRLRRYEGGRYREGGYLLMPNQLGPATLAALLPGAGADHRDRMARMANLAGTIAWIDDADTGRLAVGSAGRAQYRVPIEGANEAVLRDAFEKCAHVLLAAGATEVFLADTAGTRIRDERDLGRIHRISFGPGAVSFPAPHPGGMLRMGPDRRSSVVSCSGEAHEIPGLYVTDPSLFPTALSVDPSETIAAFSMVIADGMLARGLG